MGTFYLELEETSATLSTEITAHTNIHITFNYLKTMHMSR